MIVLFIMNSNMVNLLDTIELKTELLLEKRKQRIEKRKEKEAKKGVIKEWIEAILWAVFWVLLINQFIFQLYQIPSSSMEDTLKIGDRVFVNKYIFGPELYPSGPKIFDTIKPQRNEVIIFENPAYVSRGPLFDILNRVVYMITLSLVNIDKDEDGNPRSQLYVKRAVGDAGDTISIVDGEVFIKPQGFSKAIPEKEFRSIAGDNFTTKRRISEEDYDVYHASGLARAYRNAGLQVPAEIDENSQKQTTTSLIDYYEISRHYYKQLNALFPQNQQALSEYMKYENGMYIPENHILPIGDNRDNSIDGRYFGPVSNQDVLGKAIFKFWPISRIGMIK